MPLHHRLALRLDALPPVPVPFWVLNGASVDLDFAGGRYFSPVTGSLGVLLSCSRAGAGLAQQVDGPWLSFGTNVPRITDKGLLVEEARTNKSTNFSANPSDLTNINRSGAAAATLSVVDDTAALAAAGLQNICTSGKVYKLDNSAGVTDAFATTNGVNGNTNNCTVSAYARGSGNFFVDLSAGTGPGTGTIAATAGFVRYSASAVPSAINGACRIRATPGAVIFFILNQLEEGAFVTSPIVVAGTSVTRAADVITLIGPASTAALAAKGAYFEGGANAAVSNSRLITYISQRMTVIGSGASVRNFEGVNNADAALGSGNAAMGFKSAFGFDATGFTARANGGSLVSITNSYGALAGPVILGSAAGGAGNGNYNGYMRRVTFGPTKGMFDSLTV
jgi:hypothetical protein